MADSKPGVRSAGFHGLLWSQALGSFNDHAYKTLISLYAVSALSGAEAGRVIPLAGALFILPFIFLSTPAGLLADRLPRRDLIVLFKWVELLLMLLAFPALYSLNVPALMALLCAMGAHSAFFGPVKLAILPDIVDDSELSHANGLVQMMSFFGILLGTVAAGLLVEAYAGRLHLAAPFLAGAAAVGLACSWLVPRVPAPAAPPPLRANLLAQALEDLAELSRRRGILLAVAASAYFWFLAAIFQMNILAYGKELMGADERVISLLSVAVAVGIGLGSYVAGRLSRERVELGLVPLGALGLVAFSADLAFAYRSTWRSLADLFLMGFSGGCFVLPLQAYVQHRSPAELRGRFIAAGNLVAFAGVLAASAWLWVLGARLGLHAGQVFLVASTMTLAVAAYIVRTLPDFMMRLIFYPVSNGVYRIQAEGAANVPKEGPALLVANHVSFVDAFLIGGATQRLVRFMMFRRYYDLPAVGLLFRALGCIPVSDADGPKALARSLDAAREALKAGEVVCIFAEGEITRHGQMLRFRKGFERLVEGLDVPIIPVHLDRVWGSIFSFEGGRVLWKRPRRVPYPVTVSFGRPMPASASAHQVRQAVLDLGAEAFRHRLAERPPLALGFLREAKRHPFRFAMADSTGKRLSYGMALVQACALGRSLARRLGAAETAAVLLPPSIAGALANLGLSLMGRVPVNLNYTSSAELALACARKAGAAGIVTSRRFLEKLGWQPAPDMVFVEDVLGELGGPATLAEAAALLLLPSRLAELLLPAAARSRALDSLATVIFTSGSTGQPKGVMLTHANVLANVEGMAQLYQVRPEDRMLGVLPFFHSFGHTVTLWFPLLSGFGVVYHHNPLDAKRVGELAAEHKATFLLGTPTFLQTYLRRVEAAAFSSLRLVVVGAEKLRDDAARAFEERFGIRPLEGYGCTELSPVAAVNIPDVREPGWPKQKGVKPGTVGHPLPGVAMRVVDPETGAELPEGQAGLLLVKGPNVMKGYLGEPERTAEVLQDGYYRTGDIAAIDPDGFVAITDRLSRFSKIGGEMVPHIKVEEKLHELAGTAEQTFVVAGVPDGKRGERLVVLCKAFPDVEGLWRKLNDSGLPKLWVPGKEDFRQVPEFPLLGSGKLDMQRLKLMARELSAAAE